jgi:hypothetical protein
MGLAIYQLLRLMPARLKLPVITAISLALTLIFVNAYYDRVNSPGIMNQYHWQSITWIQDNLPTEATIFYLYGDSYDQNAQIPLGKRKSYLVNLNSYVGYAQNLSVKRNVMSHLVASIDTRFPYRKGVFSFGHYADEHNISSIKYRDFCGFDYYAIDKASAYAPGLAQYNLIIRDMLLNKPYFSEVYSNPLTSILHNTEPGADCIPPEGVSLR